MKSTATETSLVQPTDEEMRLRLKFVKKLRKFVLVRNHPPDQEKFGLVSKDGVSIITGTTRDAIEYMLRVYPGVSTNESTDAVQRTINDARLTMYLPLQDGLPENTPSKERAELANSFALATEWFSEAARLAELKPTRVTTSH